MRKLAILGSTGSIGTQALDVAARHSDRFAVTALVAHTRNVIYLEDGELAELTPDSIQVYDCSGHPITKKASRITWDIQAAEKGGYDHFMLKEIMEQPRAVEAQNPEWGDRSGRPEHRSFPNP